MVEEAKREPTVQEIVVALRETTVRGRGRGMTVLGTDAGDSMRSRSRPDFAQPDFARPDFAQPEFSPPELTRRDSPRRDRARAAALSEDGARYLEEATGYDGGLHPGIAELRDAEMQRLLGENARLNERVVYLLKIIEREQAARQAERNIGGEEREAVAQEVRGAIEAELKPVLVTVLRLLEHLQVRGDRQRPAASGHELPPVPAGGGPAERATDTRTIPAGYHSGWIPDLIRAVGGVPLPGEAAVPDPRTSDSGASDSGSGETGARPQHRERSLLGRFIGRLTSRRRDGRHHDQIA